MNPILFFSIIICMQFVPFRVRGSNYSNNNNNTLLFVITHIIVLVDLFEMWMQALSIWIL